MLTLLLSFVCKCIGVLVSGECVSQDFVQLGSWTLWSITSRSVFAALDMFPYYIAISWTLGQTSSSVQSPNDMM